MTVLEVSSDLKFHHSVSAKSQVSGQQTTTRTHTGARAQRQPLTRIVYCTPQRNGHGRDSDDRCGAGARAVVGAEPCSSRHSAMVMAAINR